MKDLRQNFLPGKIKMKKSYVKLDSNKKPLITLYGFEFPIKLNSFLEALIFRNLTVESLEKSSTPPANHITNLNTLSVGLTNHLSGTWFNQKNSRAI